MIAPVAPLEIAVERLFVAAVEWILPPAICSAAAVSKGVDDDVKAALHAIFERRHGRANDAQARFHDGQRKGWTDSPCHIISLEEDAIDA